MLLGKPERASNLRADDEAVRELKGEDAIEDEQSEEVTQEEKPKKKKKISRWRRFLTFLHIRRGYFSVWCVCTLLLLILTINVIVGMMTYEVTVCYYFK